MAIKVDLEKAYDRVRWEFIHDTLMMLIFFKILLILSCAAPLLLICRFSGTDR